MVRPETAAAQMARFSVLKRWADLDDAAKKELTRALMRECRDDEHACATASEIVRTLTWVPTPAEIASTAQLFAPREEAPRSSQRCATCHDSGIMYRRFLVTPKPGRTAHGVAYTTDQLPTPLTREEERAQWDAIQPTQTILEAADWCGCQIGAWRRTKEAEHRAFHASQQAQAEQRALDRDAKRKVTTMGDLARDWKRKQGSD